MKSRLLLLAAAGLTAFASVQATPPAAPAPVPAPPAAENAAAPKEAKEEEVPQYIRVEKTENAIQLQTAVVHLKKGNVTLDLVGAVHIGDGKFYHDLNTRFEAYDALLWEGIGGPKAPAPPEKEEVKEEPKAEDPKAEEKELTDSTGPAPKVPAAAAAKRNLNGLHTAYVNGAKYLGLTFQMNEVDYRKKNFVHADLTMDEFNDLQDQRKESLFGFMVKAGMASAKSKKTQEPDGFKMLGAILTGDKNGLKRELVGTLGAGDDQVAKIAGDSVIISDRNQKCLKVLDEQVAAGKKKVAIFYGAAHFPDMEKRLLAAGWTHTGQDWLVAWDIPN